MNHKAWIIIAKVIAVITGLYGVLLISTVAKDISMYNAHPEAYNNGLQGVLAAKSFEIAFILLSLMGAILFLFNSKIGWAMQAAMQVLFLVVIIASLSFASGTDNSKEGGAGLYAMAALMLLLCLVGFMAIFSPAVRSRYNTGSTHYILSAVFAALVIAAKYI